MKKSTKIWVNAEELNQEESFLQSAEAEQSLISLDTLTETESTSKITANRRDFLKFLGFSLGAATVASCEIPVKKAIPYVTKPEEIVPGKANYYASSFVQGGDYCAVLIKTREGRPIKVEGNALSPITQGGTSARAQASVLSLYDTSRLRSAGTIKEGKFEAATWATVDKAVAGKINEASKVAIVTHTVMSPSLKAAIAQFKVKFPNAEVITYDPISSSALLDANEISFGTRMVPDYHFDKANVIVGIEADFLGTWISPVEFAADYVKNRKAHKMQDARKEMSRHIQFESRMSLTGSNADNRLLIRPSEQAAAVALLHNEVAALAGGSAVSAPATKFAWDKATAAIKKTARELVAANGKALVVCGVNDVNVQLLVNNINAMLNSFGSTIQFAHYSNQRQGSDKAIADFTANMASYDAVFIHHANPAYDLPGLAEKFAQGLSKVKLSVSMNLSLDETTALCQFAAPDHHYLESWSDVEAKNGLYSVVQPTISPLFDTRQAGISFLTWANDPFLATASEQANYDFVKAYWEGNVFTKQSEYTLFQSFWDNALHDGVVNTAAGEMVFGYTAPDFAAVGSALPKASNAEVEVTFYETVNVGNGSYANNPWLQEMPEPVSRTTWDNFISVPLEWDGDNKYIGFKNLKDGDKATVKINGKEFTMTVVRQFGQMKGTVAISLGYGRTVVGLAGQNVGVNLYPAVGMNNGTFNYTASSVEVSGKTGHDAEYACVQLHHTFGLKNELDGKEINVDERILGHRGFQGSLTRRSVLYATTAEEMYAQGEKENVVDGVKTLEQLAERREEAEHLNQNTMYPYEKYEADVYSQGHWWGMSVDLSACIGCGACAVACIAENNVPVVGKFEVSRAHEMTWLRIDRYFYGDEETPNAAYMPMMCQHCTNAPCENVCPVNATNHSSEGLNQMTYNRCIGTRYCANNCPFKVRRFNWLDYTSADLFPWNEPNMNRYRDADDYTYMTDSLTRMVLNPDVTVRSRGVIEKCSFCVQRIQEGKLTAKTEGRLLMDGEVKSACQTACPTGAIVFGDRNQKEGQLSKLWESPLTYFSLEEINVRSSIGYMMKVTNTKEEFTS